MAYCSYYTAHVVKEKVWFFIGVLRSFEHLAFERTLDKHNSVLEFFVPADLEHYFLELIQAFEQRGIVFNVQKLPNRFMQ